MDQANPLAVALSKLDPSHDGHWTTEGMPRVDVVSASLGQAVTRKEITAAAPHLTREAAARAVERAKADADSIDDTPVDPEAEFDDMTDDELTKLVRTPEQVADQDYVREVTGLCSRRVQQLQDEARALTERIDRLNRYRDNLERASQAVRPPPDPDRVSKDITRHLDAMNAQQLKSHRRRQAVLSSLPEGLTAEDLAEVTSDRPGLDEARRQRRRTMRAADRLRSQGA